MTSRFVSILGPVLVVSAACVGPGNEARGTRNERSSILVSAAISLSEAVESLAAEFEARTGTRVRLNLGGSDTLASQIVDGAPVDLFLSANVAQMERLAARGLVDLDATVDLVANRLVIIVPGDRGGLVVEPSDLLSASVRRVAIGDPAAVPAGLYAKSYLEAQGIWAELSDKVVPMRSVRATLAAVEAGNVDAGFVYRTDLFVSLDVRLAFEIPLGDGPDIRYPAAVLRDAPNPEAAARFLADLQDPAGRARFDAAGFVPPEGRP